jgi:uncharacterized membrane protein YfhO
MWKTYSNRFLTRISNVPASILILLLILLFFNSKLFPIHDICVGGIDIKEYYLWNILFVKKQFISGNIPLWNPHYYSGHPFIANPQTFVFYPAILLFVFLPLNWALNIDVLVHLFIAALGIFYLVKLITKSKPAGIISSICFCLSSYVIDNIYAGAITMVHAAAFIPWIFYSLEKLLQSHNKKYLLLCALLFGLQILSGHPQYNFYIGLFLFIYFLINILVLKKKFIQKIWSSYSLYFIIIAILTFGIAAIQILPSIEFMNLCNRAENSYDFATFMSLPIANLITLIVPKPDTILVDVNWEYSIYFGVFSIILVLIGLIQPQFYRYKLLFGTILIISIIISFGNNTPLYKLLYYIIPGLSVFRIPSRALLIFSFSASIIIGFGVHYLIEYKLKRKLFIFSIIFVSFLIIALFFFTNRIDLDLSDPKFYIPSILLLCSVIVLTLFHFVGNKSFLFLAIISLLFIDLYINNHSQIPQLNIKELIKKRNYEKVFEDEKNLIRVSLPFDTQRGVLFNYCNINGYMPIVLDDYFSFVHKMADCQIDKHMQHTLNSAIYESDKIFSSKILNVGYAVSNGQLIGSNNVMPRAILATNYIVEPNIEKHIDIIKNQDFDPTSTVILSQKPDNDFVQKNDSENGEYRVEITKYEANRIEMQTNANSNTFLVLSELYYPGWEATIDGNEIEIQKADYLLRTIPVEKGNHTIVFKYNPWTFKLGAIISIFTLTIMIIVYFIYKSTRN